MNSVRLLGEPVREKSLGKNARSQTSTQRKHPENGTATRPVPLAVRSNGYRFALVLLAFTGRRASLCPVLTSLVVPLCKAAATRPGRSPDRRSRQGK